MDHSPESFQTHGGVVHTAYDPSNPPAHPGSDWTRFVCISDTHSRIFPIPPGDVLLHSGDLTNKGKKQEVEAIMKWLKKQKHRVKIIIAGNHDLSFHEEWYEANYQWFHKQTKESPPEIKELIGQGREDGIVYLQDTSHSFRTKEGGREWTVHGFPWQPAFHNWAFNYDRGESARAHVSTIPQVDILLTHAPPYKVLDKTRFDEDVGCPSLLLHLAAMKKPPLLHVFGHIHEAHGAVVQSYIDVVSTIRMEANPSIASNDTNNSQPDQSSEARETIMINAANMPLGPKARRKDGIRVQSGGPGFQPIIVDLLDSIQR
ncbi:Metallo-dependent phosphatase-like protein [Hygrophoropsis aurantiaca]|uniref:Metallo-dependent phosphatase-like protein n=1 Tax=Hygrophoropsis aurantiaca TaxID=72124 RepID=A0ACB8AI11_9AGAM|nr:Metallo-dependent phosphatase-like protein [Hygrophoropsis aurantiaca]